MVKISALPPAATVADADEGPIVQGGVTKKAAKSVDKTYIRPQRTRSADFVVVAENTAGATIFNHVGSLVQFAVGATGFARGKVKVPKDYAGGDIILKTMWYSATAQTRDMIYYIDAIDVGGNTAAAWNIASNLTHTNGLPLSANVLMVNSRTIPDANVSVDTHIGFAIRPGVITGTIQLMHAWIEYTADM